MKELRGLFALASSNVRMNRVLREHDWVNTSIYLSQFIHQIYTMIFVFFKKKRSWVEM
jgi:hypothetical protein